jgi:hypothetical protein
MGKLFICLIITPLLMFIPPPDSQLPFDFVQKLRDNPSQNAAT